MKNVYLFYGLMATLILSLLLTDNPDEEISCIPDPLDCIELLDCPIFDRLPLNSSKLILT